MLRLKLLLALVSIAVSVSFTPAQEKQSSPAELTVNGEVAHPLKPKPRQGKLRHTKAETE